MQLNRLRELDFLRGIAIILVLFRHQYFISYTSRMGWIGVDLFFVLSGFLVSGLLFKEFKKRGQINPKLFLIRRGFKIYPLYYAVLLVYLIPVIINGSVKLFPFISNLIFIQNYTLGFGYLFGPSWSLAIEEHFYFGLAIVLWVITKYNQNAFEVKPNSIHSPFEKWTVSIMVFCLLLRIISNVFFSGLAFRNFTMSHLRIDSLMAGVLISYLYYFRFDYFKLNFERNKNRLFILAFALLSFTPFIEPVDDTPSTFFVRTFGFSFLYISFSIFLAFFLLDSNINLRLNKLLGKHIVNLTAKIGVYSYSIYVTHDLVLGSLRNFYFGNQYVTFIICFGISILVGAGVSILLESYFLRIRDKYFANKN